VGGLYALGGIVYDARSGAEVYQQAPEWEQRLSELQAQIDRLSLSLHLWRQSQDHLQPLERRLAQLTDQCSGLLEQWTLTGERHAQAVGELEHRLSDWNDIESRLHGDTSTRLHDLERMIEHEWAALRQIHQEPVKELRVQAASLTEACVAAATSAQGGLERAEARLAGLEARFLERMSELSREIQAALGELRARLEPQPALATTAAAWPLEGVMRLHNQLRGSEPDAEPEGPLPPAGRQRPPHNEPREVHTLYATSGLGAHSSVTLPRPPQQSRHISAGPCGIATFAICGAPSRQRVPCLRATCLALVQPVSACSVQRSGSAHCSGQASWPGWEPCSAPGVSCSLTNMSVRLLGTASSDMRGRIMGLRSMAVAPLFLGGTLAGAATTSVGAPMTTIVCALIGLLIVLWVAPWIPRHPEV